MAAWGAYTGIGTFDIDVDITQKIDFGGIGGISVGFTPQTADGVVTVEYTWNEVPEPASLGMLVIGGLLAARRRR